MKKVTIIIGANSTGKSTKAKELVNGRNAVWLRHLDYKKDDFLFQQVTEKTDVIVVDEPAGIALQEVRNLINASTILVNRKYKDSIEIERPELIIVSNHFKKDHFSERPWLQIIEMK